MYLLFASHHTLAAKAELKDANYCYWFFLLLFWGVENNGDNNTLGEARIRELLMILFYSVICLHKGPTCDEGAIFLGRLFLLSLAMKSISYCEGSLKITCELDR